MSNNGLPPNEYAILINKAVKYGNGFFQVYSNELMLTNLNLVITLKGIMGGIKDKKIFGLNNIKIIDNTPQVSSSGKNESGSLIISFLHGTEFFGFSEQNEAYKWREMIINVVNANRYTASYQPPKQQQNQEEKVTVREYYYKEVPVPFNETVVTKCSSCGSSIFGKSGDIVKCNFCGSENLLKGESGVMNKCDQTGFDPNIKFCPYCGNKLPKEAVFCFRCGKKVE